MSKIKLVTFDLDGTIADTAPELLTAINDSRRHMGFADTTIDVLYAGLNRGVDKLIRTCFPELKTQEEADRALEIYKSYYDSRCLDTKLCYDGIPECIEKLRDAGITVALLTNKMSAMMDKMIPNIFGLSPFYRTIGANSGYPRKPDPTSLLALMEEVDATPEETVHIGDSDIDILTAKAANALAYGVAWGYVSEEVLLKTGADKIAHHASEITDFILSAI